jgi:hypothetical protein
MTVSKNLDCGLGQILLVKRHFENKLKINRISRHVAHQAASVLRSSSSALFIYVPETPILLAAGILSRTA